MTQSEQSMKLLSISPTQRFILAMDQAYFKAVFFSADRPGVMGQVKVPEILRFPNNDGWLFNHVWGKTLRDGNFNIFGIQRNPQSKLCRVRGIEQYLAVSDQLRVDLSGYLFHPTNPRGATVNEPFSSSAAVARPKTYLKQMGSG